MSLDGSPSTAMRSAWSPGAIAPIASLMPNACAPSEVADTIASIGGWPPSCTRQIRSSTLRPCAPATASVPHTILRPGRCPCTLECFDREGDRFFHRREARLRVVADAFVLRPIVQVVPEDEATLRIEEGAPLRHESQHVVRRKDPVLDLRAPGECRRFHTFGAVRVHERAQSLHLRFATERVELVLASAWRCRHHGCSADAKILMKSAPSAFRRRTTSRIESGARRGAADRLE